MFSGGRDFRWGSAFFPLLSLTSGIDDFHLVSRLALLDAQVAQIYGTCYSALMPEITLADDERTRWSTFRQIAGHLLGDIGGALIPFAALCCCLNG